MKSRPVRLVLYVIVPAALGAGTAWTTRPDGAMSAAAPAVNVPGKPRPGSTAPGAGKPAGPGLLTDSALAEQRRFCERLQGADLPLMMTMLDETQTFADAFRRRSVRTLVMEQMALTDPASAWLLLETWEKGNYRNQFLQAWAQVDAEGALTWAEGQGKDGVNFAGEIVTGLVPDNMAAFVKILPRLKPDHISTERVGTAFRLLAGENPAAAVQLLDTLGGGGKQNTATSALGEGWARRDAKAAYAWAKELTDPAQRESALRGVFRAWAETDPKGTAARLDELTKDPAMAKAAAGESPLADVVRAWAAQDPKAAAAWLRTRPEVADGRTFGRLLTSEILPSRDDWNALEMVDLIRRSEEKALLASGNSAFSSGASSGYPADDSYRWVIGKFGGYNSPFRQNSETWNGDSAFRVADPAGAFDNLAKLPADAARQEVLHEVAAQWVGQDREAAAAKFRELTDPWLKLGLVNALASNAHQTLDVDLASSISTAFPDSRFPSFDIFFRNFYAKLAELDPTRAEALLATELSPERKKLVAHALATQQAAYDPVGALDWAARQPEAQIRHGATRSAMSAWTTTDAYAASEWLAAQTAGPVKEAAVEGLVGSLNQTAPEEAFQWAGSLTDKSRRESFQIDTLRMLMWRDEVKARELAAGLVLSEGGQRQMQANFDSQAGSR